MNLIEMLYELKLWLLKLNSLLNYSLWTKFLASSFIYTHTCIYIHQKKKKKVANICNSTLAFMSKMQAHIDFIWSSQPIILCVMMCQYDLVHKSHQRRSDKFKIFLDHSKIIYRLDELHTHKPCKIFINLQYQ